MKKAARSAVVLITCSSLLYGCDVPTSLEDFVGWREKFFLHVDSSTIGNLLGPLLGILIALALCLSLYGLIQNLRRGDAFWEGSYLIGFTIMLSIGFIYLCIPVATRIGETVLPDELTLDNVVNALHWELTADFTKLLTSGWGLAFTLLIPLISAFWQILMLVSSIVALMISTVGRSFKGVVFAFSQVFGWALFLVLYSTLVFFIGEYYPTWDFSVVESFVSAFYIFAVLLLMMACYIGVPFLSTSLVPSNRSDEVSSESEKKEKIRREMDWDILEDLPPLIPVPFPTGDKNQDDHDADEK